MTRWLDIPACQSARLQVADLRNLKEAAEPSVIRVTVSDSRAARKEVSCHASSVRSSPERPGNGRIRIDLGSRLNRGHRDSLNYGEPDTERLLKRRRRAGLKALRGPNRADSSPPGPPVRAHGTERSDVLPWLSNPAGFKAKRPLELGHREGAFPRRTLAGRDRGMAMAQSRGVRPNLGRRSQEAASATPTFLQLAVGSEMGSAVRLQSAR